MVAHRGDDFTKHGRHERGKPEHDTPIRPEGVFPELYVPVLDVQQSCVLGAIALYKTPRGLGGGLALARRVVERLGGRIEIDSVPGRGTRVYLHLPRA